MDKIKALFKNKKFLRIFIPALIIVVALGAFAYVKLSDDSIGVELGTVEYGTVQQFYDTTGTLASGSVEKYYLYEGIVVKEVNVKTGDAVCKGDVLATFDTSSMNAIVSEKAKALNDARKAYNDAVESQNGTSTSNAEAQKELASLKAQREELEKSEANNSGSNGGQFTDEQIKDIIAALGGNNGSNGSQFTEDELADIASKLSSSSTSSLDDLNSQISLLESQLSMSGSGQYGSLVDTYKQTLDAAREEYNKVVAEKKALDKGWIASADGKVADVYIKAGEAYVYVEDKDDSNDMLSMIMGSGSSDMTAGMDVSSLLSGVMGSTEESAKQGLGMVVDYYDGYKITFNLGKYDAQTIKVGMKAFVSYTDYDYEAEVTYISPYAESGSSAITTMMGSSSTTTSALPAEATIKNSDNNLIIGFDAKLSILVAEHENVLKLPVEALVIEEGKKFVYIYDEATSTAVKREIETGVSSDTHYEVLDGLSEGDSVIINSSKVSDGASVSVKK